MIAISGGPGAGSTPAEMTWSVVTGGKDDNASKPIGHHDSGG